MCFFSSLMHDHVGPILGFLFLVPQIVHCHWFVPLSDLCEDCQIWRNEQRSLVRQEITQTWVSNKSVHNSCMGSQWCQHEFRCVGEETEQDSPPHVHQSLINDLEDHQQNPEVERGGECDHLDPGATSVKSSSGLPHGVPGRKLRWRSKGVCLSWHWGWSRCPGGRNWGRARLGSRSPFSILKARHSATHIRLIMKV